MSKQQWKFNIYTYTQHNRNIREYAAYSSVLNAPQVLILEQANTWVHFSLSYEVSALVFVS